MLHAQNNAIMSAAHTSISNFQQLTNDSFYSYFSEMFAKFLSALLFWTANLSIIIFMKWDDIILSLPLL